MRHQEVEYDFKFYKLKFKSEYPVVVFSEGKSLFPVSIQFYFIFILFFFSIYLFIHNK